MSGGKNIRNCKISCNPTELGGWTPVLAISPDENSRVGGWKWTNTVGMFDDFVGRFGVMICVDVSETVNHLKMVWFMLSYHISNIFTFKVVKCSTGLVLKARMIIQSDGDLISHHASFEVVVTKNERTTTSRLFKGQLDKHDPCYNMLIDSLRVNLVGSILHRPSPPRFLPTHSWNQGILHSFAWACRRPTWYWIHNWLRSSADSGNMSCVY